MGLFTKKSLADLQAEADRGLLKRSLGPWNLTALGIGSIIGTGIFVLTGTAASQNAGPALVLSMIISAVGCAFAGLCYAEFAAMVPVAGSAYTYAYATVGEIFAWIIGWDLILEYALSTATVAVGWSGYFVSLMNDIGIHVPASMAGSAGPITCRRWSSWCSCPRCSSSASRSQRTPTLCWWRSRRWCWSCSSWPARPTSIATT
jgi:APA family basic amino acid/polyamine antiporter